MMLRAVCLTGLLLPALAVAAPDPCKGFKEPKNTFGETPVPVMKFGAWAWGYKEVVYEWWSFSLAPTGARTTVKLVKNGASDLQLPEGFTVKLQLVSGAVVELVADKPIRTEPAAAGDSVFTVILFDAPVTPEVAAAMANDKPRAGQFVFDDTPYTFAVRDAGAVSRAATCVASKN